MCGEGFRNIPEVNEEQIKLTPEIFIGASADREFFHCFLVLANHVIVNYIFDK